jgi:hypothetical protein
MIMEVLPDVVPRRGIQTYLVLNDQIHHCGPSVGSKRLVCSLRKVAATRRLLSASEAIGMSS